MSLTDIKLRQAKPASSPYRLADGKGLFIEVRPNGSKLWRYAYRIGKKQSLFAIGAYPETSLQAARTEHLRARALVANGVHPAHEKAKALIAAIASNEDTFQKVAEEFVEAKKTKGGRKGWSASYEKQVNDYLESDVFPKIGRRPIRSIVPADVLAIIKEMEYRGAEAAAIFVRQLISQIFRWAIPQLRVEHDPAQVLRGAINRPKVQHASPKSRDEIRDLLVRLRAYSGNVVTKSSIRLMLYLFLRTNELRRTPWIEIRPALDSGLWSIPEGRMKMRRRHLVPLPRQAIDLLRQLESVTGKRNYLFPNIRRPTDVMTATTINRALEHMGYPSGFFTGHDFRATASTLLHEMGYREEVVEMQLAHAKKNKVGAIYNHAQYLPERKAMMQAWADWIDEIEKDCSEATPPAVDLPLAA